MRYFHWTSSSGRLNLTLRKSDVESASHPGPCDGDVEYLADLPRIAKQTTCFDPRTLADELREYGAWDAGELADHAQNIHRVLWIACGDCADNPGCYA